MKMTEQEAIERIRAEISFYAPLSRDENTNVLIKALQLAIQALEKRIAKPIVVTQGHPAFHTKHHTCPTCGFDLDEVGIIFSHCPNPDCGQKLKEADNE
jgi:hypothetical protein